MTSEQMVVLGAGQMGSGIAQVALQAGLSVTLVDASAPALEKAGERIRGGLGKLQSKGLLSESQVKAASAALITREALTGLREFDFAIEAVTEDEGLKRSLFQALDEVVKPGGVLATNTSSISITRIAAATRRPQSVIGMHFMNPVPLMKLGTNTPMGPLELADFIGLDTCLYIAQVLHDGLGDDKYRPSPLLRQYVDAGWLGRKSGRGFHSYL